jgi:hypothetical protein
MGCGRARDDGGGAWIGIKEYLEKSGIVLLSRRCCPPCEARLSATDSVA